MDWNNVNVALDQDALRAAQEAGGHGFSFPWWVWLIIIVVAIALGATAIKKAKGGDTDGKADAGDKK